MMNGSPGKKSRKPRSADYLKIVEWSEEDDCYVGSAPPLIGRSCHGSDEVEVYKELSEIVEEWIAMMERDGTALPPPMFGASYSGNFVLRAGPELHKALVIRASLSGDGLNTFCVKRLNEAVTGKTPRGTVKKGSISANPGKMRRLRVSSSG
jgi:predicted HicB family RNase H-like nuclease